MADPVGLVEIAQRLGVDRRRVEQWRYRSERGEMRNPLPEPQYTVSGQPAWEWRRIEKWARLTGRLPTA